MPTNLNGGFASQEEFRNFVLERYEDGKWDASIHARPSANRLADYKGETLAKAFPIVFPYGHSGGPDDPAIAKLKALYPRKPKKWLQRSRKHALQKYLHHRKPAFHSALFNLIICNILMKQKIFDAVRIHANYQYSDGVSYGERFGILEAEKLRNAVIAVRNNHSSQYAARPEEQFLRSIYASCRDLPHSNEASMEARKIYFSYIMEFGLPTIFLTVTPDDGRNYRIVLYAFSEERQSSNADLPAASMSDEQILLEFKIRQRCRTDNPGLCAEEYHRIMTLIIKHLFQWDEKKQKSTGKGCFGELLAWCLATEEQGRKTLHGHFLLFVKNWQPLMELVQLRKQGLNFTSIAEQTLIQFCAHISSARLFADCDRLKGILGEHSPFTHDGCKTKQRGTKRKRYECTGADEQILREMRHKVKCTKHCGFLGTCPICKQNYTMNQIVQGALQSLLKANCYQYPDANKRLEHFVYNSQQEKSWFNGTEKSIALRYFAHNAMVNIHNPLHATRCFKRNTECYANLPEMPLKKNSLYFKESADNWFDFKGNFKQRYMFRFYPQRHIEDAFMNVHSPLLTKCFANNTNVLAAMNGPVVFYVTGYQAKKQQKEEKEAYTKVSETIFKMLQKRNDEAETDVPPHQEGFRRLLAGIYAQTSAHIVAAPMAHFLALHESRFRYSHDTDFLPVIGIENFLLEQNTTGTIRMHNGKAIWYHKAMDYIFRPIQLEHMNMHQLCRMTKAMRKYEASKLGIPEHEQYAFTEEHPFMESYCIIYRLKDCVPSFPWNWLGSTAEFEIPLTVSVEPTHKTFAAREEYCRRILMLFVPFRALRDLQHERTSTFQLAFANMVQSKQIPDEMERIANNIQDIHNSIRVTMPTNMLTDITYLVDEEETNAVMRNLASTADQELHLQTMIAGILAETEHFPNALTSSATELEPKFLKIYENLPMRDFDHTGEKSRVIPDTVVYENIKLTAEPEPNYSQSQSSRFITSVVTLNTLVLQTLIVAHDRPNHNRTKNATGSVASIIRWCENDHLDTNQQIATEIMVATYVLTFHEDATGHDCLEETEGLKKLARQRPNTNDRLRMFITGPAGAGKCKCGMRNCFRLSVAKCSLIANVVLLQQKSSKRCWHIAKLLAKILATSSQKKRFE